MSGLEASDVGFGFSDGTAVLSHVNLSVARGEFVAILGANASGKSTLLRLLSGLLRPTLGQVTVDDIPVVRVRDRVGLVFQNPDHQMIAPTVEEELALGLELRGIGVPDIRARVEEVLRQFDLLDMRDRSPESLSGGQKQRVALAAIMTIRPEYLLFDEPDSLLDAPSRREWMSAVELIRHSCGIVWTSPHPKRLPQTDRTYELADGVVHERS